MKKGKKPLLCLVLALCTLMTPAITQTAAAQEEPVTIFYTNDIHTYIDNDNEEEIGWNYAKLAHLKDSVPDALLVDAGDHVQGTAYGSMDNGKTVVNLMKSAGYDLATLGNHEFDYGMLRALEVTESGIPYVSCNFYNEKDGVRGSNVLDSYKIFTAGGKKVAFVGITTPESFTKSTPAYFQDENGKYIYGISGGENGEALYEDVQEAINAARADGADYVVALGHLGVDESSAPYRSTDVIANVSGLDAFIDGHSHHEIEAQTVTDKDGEEVVLTQTGSYFNAVGKMTIAADGKITTELLFETPELDGEGNPPAGYVERKEDPDTANVEQNWIDEINEQLGEVIGYAQVTFDNYDKDGNRLVRRQETNTGDFAADALYYLFDELDYDVDVAVMNGGGIRNGAVSGELTYLDCKDIHTFGNVACLQQVTGRQILDALEWGAKDYSADNIGSESGGFLHVSGLTYEINPYIPSTVRSDEHGVWTGGPTGEYRVRNVMVYDRESGEYEPLNLEAYYNLAGYNYTLRDLGDGFAMFEGAENVIDYVMEDYVVLANYVKSFPLDAKTGLPTITAENSPYGDVYGEGRIVARCAHDVQTLRLEGAVAATAEKEGYTGDAVCPTCGQTVKKGEIIAALAGESGEQSGGQDQDAAAGQTPQTGDENQAELIIFALAAAASLAGAAAAARQARRRADR